MAESRNTQIIRDAWDQYQGDYLKFNIKDRPDFYAFFEKGGTDLSKEEMELAGDVSGLDLLDTCCAADARQSLSWANLGASVTGCDITARRIGKDITFVVADAQTLEPIDDASQDLLYATYIVWLEDLSQAARTWHRVLRPGGRLPLRQSHPLMACLEEQDDGSRKRCVCVPLPSHMAESASPWGPVLIDSKSRMRIAFRLSLGSTGASSGM